MPDREKVIEGLRWILECDLFGFGNNWGNGEPRCDEERAGKYIWDAIELLKEHDQARCENCWFRDFGENEVDSWDLCKLHRHGTSPDEFCSWFMDSHMDGLTGR